MVIEGLLTPLGYKLTPAMDGTEALDIIRSRKYLPDLILLDVQMPCLTGYEVNQLHQLLALSVPFQINQLHRLLALLVLFQILESSDCYFIPGYHF
jgi:CheY-like chemotaxis protein